METTGVVGWTALRTAIAAVAAVVLLLPPAASAGKPRGASRAPAVERKAVFVFRMDTDNITAPNADDLARTAARVVVSRLELSGRFVVTEFYKGYPSVVRLLSDQELTTADVTPPFAEDKRKAAKIIKLTGYDMAFISAVTDYQYDSAKKQVTVEENGLLLETANDKIGYRVVKNTAGTGTATVGEAGEAAAAIQAVRNATDQLMTGILASPKPAAAKGAGSK